MKGFKFWEKKPSNGPFTHDSTGTSKYGTGTKSVLSGCLGWYRYHTFFFFFFFFVYIYIFFLVAVPIYKTFQNALHLGFHWMLTFFSCFIPLPT